MVFAQTVSYHYLESCIGFLGLNVLKVGLDVKHEDRFCKYWRRDSVNTGGEILTAFKSLSRISCELGITMNLASLVLSQQLFAL